MTPMLIGRTPVVVEKVEVIVRATDVTRANPMAGAKEKAVVKFTWGMDDWLGMFQICIAAGMLSYKIRSSPVV